MANNTFEFVGRLSIGKESEKFKPYSVTNHDSGWCTTRLLFNVVAGDNRHLLEVKGLHKLDGTGIVYSFTKGGTNPTTNEKIKGESLKVKWADRYKPEILEQVAEFKKFVLDLEVMGRRYKLEKAVEKLKDGTITDDELVELNVDDPISALEDSKKKRKEFIHETDFAEYIYKLLTNEKTAKKVANAKFKVTGEIVYSEYEGKFHKKLVPTRIYMVSDETETISQGNMVVFFNKESLDSASVKDKGNYYINGYIRNYDNQRKVDIAAPVQLVLNANDDGDENKAKKIKVFVNQLTVKDKTWKELGLKVNLLNGQQKMDITDDMLTDFQKEMLELEMITLDDIRKEIGGDIYGEKIEEIHILNVSKGYTKGRKDTVYIDSDFVVAAIVKEEKSKSEQQTEEEDLFDDLDI